MKTVLLLVLIVSAIAIVGLLWRSRRAGSAIGETTSPPPATGQAATDAGRHRNTSAATEAAAPVLPDGRAGGAHRA